MKRIISIAGTNRPDNYTSRALALVNDELRKKGIEPDVVDARTLTLSFPGYPETADARKLRQQVRDASGIVLATPEYHGTFSAMTKLIIESLGFPSVLSGKPVALLGVASGRIGAIKSIEQLRAVCSHTGAIVLPGAVSVAGVRNVFQKDGRCTDAGVEKSIRSLAQALVEFLKEYVLPKQALEEIVRDHNIPWSATL